MVSFIHFMGEPIGYANMLMPAWLILVVVVFLALVCAGSALLGLRKVAVSPLGVRTKSLERKFPVAKVIITVLVICLLPVVYALTQSGGLGVGIVLGAVVGFFALGLVVVDLLGGPPPRSASSRLVWSPTNPNVSGDAFPDSRWPRSPRPSAGRGWR